MINLAQVGTKDNWWNIHHGLGTLATKQIKTIIWL